MKFGLDVHGVIDTDIEFFSHLTRSLMLVDKDRSNSDLNWEIHIITGSNLTNGEIIQDLKECKILYTHMFSISDYLRKEGCQELDGSTIDNPLFPEDEWNKAKANYCRKHAIDLHLDDSDRYAKYFTTPVARFYSKDKK